MFLLDPYRHSSNVTLYWSHGSESEVMRFVNSSFIATVLVWLAALRLRFDRLNQKGRVCGKDESQLAAGRRSYSGTRLCR